MVGPVAAMHDAGIISFSDGVIAGFIAGVAMGFISELSYRLKIFKSSLVLIDGNFPFRLLGRQAGIVLKYAVGIPFHLITSAMFGGIYVVLSGIFNISPVSPYAVAFYFLILWLSMVFIALPVAGEGIAGRKTSPWMWSEQLFLHIVFGLKYFVVLGHVMR